MWFGTNNHLLIGQSWGVSGPGAVDYHQTLFAQNKFAGGSALSEPVIGEKLAMVWSNYNSMASAMFNLLGRIANMTSSYFHNVGFCGYYDNGLVYIGNWGASYITLTNDGVGFSTSQDACAQAVNMHMGTLEGLAIQTAIDVNGICAARMIDTDVVAGHKIFDATSACVFRRNRIDIPEQIECLIRANRIALGGGRFS